MREDQPEPGIEQFPYRICTGDGVVVAVAASATLAFAMYRAAATEHFGREVVLRRRHEVLARAAVG